MMPVISLPLGAQKARFPGRIMRHTKLWAVLEEPPRGTQWRHLGIISHFVRGYWFEPIHPQTGPGLLEHLRLPLHRLYQFRIDADYDLIPIETTRAEECIETAARTIAEIEQRIQGESP